MKNLESNTKEVNLPVEYLEKARKLAAKRMDAEENLYKNHPTFNGRDDSLSPKIRELDMQFRRDLTALRKEYLLD